MHALRRFFRLPRRDRALVLRSLLFLGAARTCLWMVSFPTAWNLVRRLTRSEPKPATDPGAVTRLVWAIDRASAYVPDATCLTQALAAKVLLHREGFPSVLRIGVARDTEGQFEAHAWLECEGHVIIGGPEDHLTGYSSFPPLGD